MVSKCANPDCSAPFLYLHDGRIYALRSKSQRESDVTDAVAERYWLCGNCSARLTLVLRNGGVVLESLSQMSAVSWRPSAATSERRPAA